MKPVSQAVRSESARRLQFMRSGARISPNRGRVVKRSVFELATKGAGVSPKNCPRGKSRVSGRRLSFHDSGVVAMFVT